MKRWLPLVLAFLLFLVAAWASLPASWRPTFAPQAIAQAAQAPMYAAEWAAAFCRWDAQYLSDHGAGRLAASAERIAAAAGNAFASCAGVRYLGALDPTGDGARYVFVLRVTDSTTHDEAWVFTFGPDGKAVGLGWAD